MTSRIAKLFVCAFASICLALSGCAATKQEFYAKKDDLWDWSVCKTWREASASGDVDFRNDVYAEILKRNMTGSGCNTRNNVADIGAVSVIVLGVVAAALAAGGGGGNPGVNDYDWAWDQFRDQSGSLVWACRGRQSGQFAEQWRCNGKLMTDATWPGPNI